MLDKRNNRFYREADDNEHCRDCADYDGVCPHDGHKCGEQAARAASPVPAGWKLLKDSTQDERTWHEDAGHENGNYYCLCHHCGRQFVGHKRRVECKVCAMLAASPASPAQPAKLTDADVKAMVDRFLGWKLPKDFCPDAGISFKPTKPYEGDEYGNSWWPIGTNLLTAEQAKAMFIHALGGAAQPTPQPPQGAQQEPLTDEQIERAIERHVGGAELTDDDYDSMRTFARAIEAASRGKSCP
jgi:hypothetical protein